MEGVDINDIVQLLLPSQARLLQDIWLYLILAFVLITLFMQPEGSITITLLLAVVAISIFIDKVQAFPGHLCSFGTLVIRVGMFVIPLITAGVTQNPKSRGPAVIAAVLGLGYTFVLWFFEMNNRAVCRPLERDITMLMEGLGLL